MTEFKQVVEFVSEHPMAGISETARHLGVNREVVYQARRKLKLPMGREVQRILRARRAQRLIDWAIEHRLAGGLRDRMAQFDLSYDTFLRALRENPYLRKRWDNRYQLMKQDEAEPPRVESEESEPTPATVEGSITSAAQEGEHPMATNPSTSATLRSQVRDWVVEHVEPGGHIPLGSLTEALGEDHRRVQSALAGIVRDDAAVVERYSRGSYRRTNRVAVKSEDNGGATFTGDLFEAVGLTNDGTVVVRHEGDQRLYRLMPLG